MEQLKTDITQAIIALRDTSFDHYFSYEFLSWRWWVNLALLVVPLVIWWFNTDKKRLLEIALFGLLVNGLCALLDVIGSNYVLWIYPVHILPQVSLLTPVDYVFVPVVGMWIYRKFARWPAFLIAGTAASATMSFIGEPLAVFIGVYELVSWRYIYSLPIYIAIFAAAKAVTGRFILLQKKARDRA